MQKDDAGATARDLAALRETLTDLAEKATPGPWDVGSDEETVFVGEGDSARVIADCYESSGGKTLDHAAIMANAAFIAAANPSAVLTLCAELDRLALENALLRQDAPETAALRLPLKEGDAVWVRATVAPTWWAERHDTVTVDIINRMRGPLDGGEPLRVGVPREHVAVPPPSTEAATLRAENARWHAAHELTATALERAQKENALLAAQVEAVRAQAPCTAPDDGDLLSLDRCGVSLAAHESAPDLYEHLHEAPHWLRAALATEPAAARTLPASVKAMREEA